MFYELCDMLRYLVEEMCFPNQDHSTCPRSKQQLQFLSTTILVSNLSLVQNSCTIHCCGGREVSRTAREFSRTQLQQFRCLIKK